MSSLKDIWNSSSGNNIPQEKLLAYLEGRLPDAEQHEVERLLGEDSLENDALEGLQSLTPEDAKQSTDKLNRTLHSYLQQRKKRRKKQIAGNYWGWIAILVILMLAVVGFILFRMSQVS